MRLAQDHAPPSQILCSPQINPFANLLLNGCGVHCVVLRSASMGDRPANVVHCEILWVNKICRGRDVRSLRVSRSMEMCLTNPEMRRDPSHLVGPRTARVVLENAAPFKLAELARACTAGHWFRHAMMILRPMHRYSGQLDSHQVRASRIACPCLSVKLSSIMYAHIILLHDGE